MAKGRGRRGRREQKQETGVLCRKSWEGARAPLPPSARARGAGELRGEVRRANGPSLARESSGPRALGSGSGLAGHAAWVCATRPGARKGRGPRVPERSGRANRGERDAERGVMVPSPSSLLSLRAPLRSFSCSSGPSPLATKAQGSGAHDQCRRGGCQRHACLALRRARASTLERGEREEHTSSAVRARESSLSVCA